MHPGRLAGLLVTALLAGSILQDAVEARRSLNKCCSLNDHIYYDTTLGRFECTKLLRTAPPTDAGKDAKFGKFLTALSVAANASFHEDDVVAGVAPNCADADTDWLFAPNFRLRATPTAVTLRASRRHEFAAHAWCVDLDDEEDLVAVVCPCGGTDTTCVKKCCRHGEALYRQLECVESDSKPWTPTPQEPNMSYYLLNDKVPKCKLHTFESFQRGQLKLQPNGSVKGGDVVFAAGQYCVDVDVNATDDDRGDLVLFCIQIDSLSDAVSVFKGVLALLGALALLVTVVITAMFPEMRQSILDKMVLCHNASLLVAFLCIAVPSLIPQVLTPVFCQVMSFVLQYTLLAAFFWLNVMCIEISRMFSALQQPSNLGLAGSKFMWYSVYAWGATLVISIITLLVEFTPGTTLKPRFGESYCFFHGDDKIPQLLFLFGPMAILIGVNVILFVYTATKIMRHKSEPSSSKTNKRKKQNLILFVKLFTLMGITWVFEIISWAVGGKNYYWLAIDCINLLRGVFIFIMICCTRSVLKLVRARCGCAGSDGDAQGSAASHLTGESQEEHEMDVAK